MKLLYVACGHPLLEADDCLNWNKLGIDWQSTGYYANSSQPGDLPYIQRHIPNDWLKKYNQQEGCIDGPQSSNEPIGNKNIQFTNIRVNTHWKFTADFVDSYDVIVCNCGIENVINNWEIFKNKTVILKTFAMHNFKHEPLMKEYRNKGLLVVRTSAREHLRPKYHGVEYGGHDAIIRGSIVLDDKDINSWIGNIPKVVTLTNNFNHPARETQVRRRYYQNICQQYDYLYVNDIDLTKGLFFLYGASNDKDVLSQGFLTHNQKIRTLKESRVCLCTGTPNANITYSFVEAWMMGIPQVVFGQKMWQGTPYEPNVLLQHGLDGFIAQTPGDAAYYINLLLSDYKLAKQMGAQASQRALRVFGRNTICRKWKGFFEEQGFSL